MSEHEPDLPAGEGAETSAPAAPRRRSTGRRVLLAVAVVLVTAIVAVTVFGVVTVRRPLPQTSGRVDLPVLDASVTVVRDDQGVPQIYADTPQDLFRAQGYVQAQDRFFEMDYRRHVTAGRLAELVGDDPDAIAADKVTRTFGWREVAEEEWDLVDEDTRTYLRSYAEGVNAYLDARAPADVALEYTVLGAQVQVADPEPWDPIDSLAWLKAMAWDLRGNYDDELDRALAYGTLQDTARVTGLFPPYPSDVNLPIVGTGELENPQRTSQDVAARDALPYEDDHLQAALAAADRALSAVPVTVGRGEGTGSNSWVVAGEHTASGKPLLANDPHLALGAPSVWAQVGLHCNDVGPLCGFDVAGFSFAGFPGVVIGHNAQLAWGLTNMGADVTDFFVERVRDDTYLRGDSWEPLETRTETLRVNGGQDVTLEVRSTVHGPIISSVLPQTDAATGTPSPGTRLGEYAVSLQWTALEPGRTADAVFAFNLAADAEDISTAAALFEVPAQNIVFATVDGHIGYQAPGRVPRRHNVADSPVPTDGTWPRDGSDARFDWDGYVPSEQMPQVLDPAEGFVVAANQAVLPAGVSPFLTTDWDYGYRSQRIRTMLEEKIAAGSALDVDDMSAVQLDDRSPYAEVLVPILLDQEIDDPFDAEGQDLLADWDYRTDTDSAAAAYFNAVWRNLLELTFWDDLPVEARPSGGSRWLAVVQGLVDDPTDPFWDDRQTVSIVETRDEVLSRALVSARRDLTVAVGKRPDDWAWGDVHRLALEHPVLGGESVPGLVRDYVNPDPIGVAGGSSVVDATAWDAASGSFDVTAGPSMRMVVDLGDLDGSTWVTVTGSSGHPASPHYTDQLDEWAAGETFAWPFSRAAVTESGQDELTLEP
ncbi:penicillin acylase family protein [Cellulosimicrobium arenosum]|uniref:penicillin acylase family protein n=1 Tax=Cellulosimicrobium arenosum TaxID=2708133 RepID=UPI003BADAC78